MALLILGSLALAACGGDDGDDGNTATTTTSTTDEEENPDVHTCEHLGEASVQVAASADAATAPVEELGHVTYEVTLQNMQGVYSGFMGLTVPADAGGEYVVFLTTATDLKVVDSTSTTLTVTDDCTEKPCSDVCATILSRYEVNLPAGDYTLAIGPTADAKVRVLFSATAHAQ
ncbi:Hypothetical protein CAP_6656 [Chondromyces apiculatus DSM 436]|uniref:Uncharacterized protein n=2 Tax=Chondromyces apiculatus TaxID=51 RepID=A0A017T261_9BACT|nr:Hypothetical protein CAP_6656 [Chondromyces apiculatus DSM 436]